MKNFFYIFYFIYHLFYCFSSRTCKYLSPIQNYIKTHSQQKLCCIVFYFSLLIVIRSSIGVCLAQGKNRRTRYIVGRGMPSYLLDRAYDESSIDSDGAPRNFADTHSTIATAKDTDSSATSNISYSWFCMSMSSMNESRYSCLNSEQISLNNESSVFFSFICDESSDTRILQSETPLN